MKAINYVLALVLLLTLTLPAMAEIPDIPDTGTLYGDLYVILRDVNGVPVLSEPVTLPDENGDPVEYSCIQPISTVTASFTITTDGDPLVINVTAGEPFALPTYIDSVGDLVECELPEEMADWVQTVDFGRLNLGRAPDSVIEHAFDEAINKMNEANEISVDPAGRLVLALPDPDDPTAYLDKTIDAPAENLALYIKMMIDGDWITLEEDLEPTLPSQRPDGKGPPEGDGPSTEPRPVLNESAIGHLNELGYTNLGDATKTNTELNSHHLTLAASLLAAAADKSGSITLDMVVYINFIFGINQVGSISTSVEGETYFDFGAYSGDGSYNRNVTYGSRQSGLCDPGWVWVLQPEIANSVEVPNHFTSVCMEIMGYENGTATNAVHFTHMVEAYTTVFDDSGNPLEYNFTDNVRAFTQACDDALQVIEYIHNYKIPEVLYPLPVPVE